MTALSLWAAAAGTPPPGVKVTPDVVRMGAFYGGATVRVEGARDADATIIVAVRGPTVTEVFNHDGRAGFLWVNTAKVTISEVPSLWLVFSSERVGACLPRAVIDQYGLDQAALKKQMRIQCQACDQGQIAEEYLNYKAMQGSYRRASGDFRKVAASAAGVSDPSFRFEFEFPRCATPGEYQVRVLECRGGEVSASLEVPLRVVEVGFPSFISGMASRHASFYGMLSVLVALLAGLGIDFLAAQLFKRREAANLKSR
jgi:hypothetical protein